MKLLDRCEELRRLYEHRPGLRPRVRQFQVVFEPEEEGGYHVYAPALKGCHSWGTTKDEARQKIREAIELWLETAKERGIPILETETIEVPVE
ncbi:MAG: type II toxin-antitoxin system HicB family antitoxin [Chloroflexi bacterium]|nr:type II toxin-antitoxin system HicB family antitoxin [Chloroflexota bacterium]